MQSPFIKYIANTQHYDDVLARVASVKNTLWIGTADIKDVYVKSGMTAIPLLAVFDKLVKRSVAIRLIHAKEPGPIFRKEHEKFPALWSSMEMTLCPRIHFKLDDIRHGNGIHRFSQSYRCRYRYEERTKKKLRGRHPDE